jgi:hypothetical protein
MLQVQYQYLAGDLNKTQIGGLSSTTTIVTATPTDDGLVMLVAPNLVRSTFDESVADVTNPSHS